MEGEIVSRVSGAAIDGLSERVGELVTSLWDFSLGLLVNLIFLQRNAEHLAEEMGKLEELRDDLISRAAEERHAQHEVTKRVSGWINRVENLRSKVASFEDAFERQSICTTGLCLGYNAAQLLREVKKLMEEGNALNALPPNELVCRRSPDVVGRVPFEISSSSMVGAGEPLGRIQDYLLEKRIGIIGIYGMGGVGKTSLLKIIKNEFLQGAAKDLLGMPIWVKVSRDVKVLEIQKTIGNQLMLSLSDHEQQGEGSCLVEQQANRLFSELSKKSFILLLDDVWDKLDLLMIGIPLPKNVKGNCKILFTTRSKKVCDDMDTDQTVDVRPLGKQHSWELFQSKLRSNAVLNDPEIRQLAEQVMEKCGGLPISLITVGRAMANATASNVWRNALNKLDHLATELEGMEDVLDSLKFSYEMLRDNTLRSCLLYCGLFPEYYRIPKREIIDYWVCEGFLDPEHSEDIHIDDTRDRGHAQIRDLQNAYLLEEGDINWKGEETVRLHDTVRDMVQWITRQDFVVLSDSTNTARVPQLGRWEAAKRISLWRISGSLARVLPSGKLNCPDLTTLLLTDLPLKETKGFLEFKSPALRVLGVTHFSLGKIPMQITSLVQLQYLDLTLTAISSLPAELGKLVNLRQLILSWTFSLRSIPREAISRLTHLQVLNMERSAYVFSRQTCHPQLELGDLENLPRLCELSLEVRSWPSVKRIADSNMLRERVRCMNVNLDFGSPSGDIITKKIDNLSSLRKLSLSDNPENPVVGELRFRPNQLPDLEDLWLVSFKEAKLSWDDRSSSRGEPLFPRLRELFISEVHGFTELTWVGQLPRLETLTITDNDGVTELLLHGAGLPHDGSTPPFPKLKSMELKKLPVLRRISTCPLDFPSLEEILVLDCPCLKRLPFGPEGAKNIRLIEGQQEWWDGLEWDDYPDGTSFKSKFLPYFKAWTGIRVRTLP